MTRPTIQPLTLTARHLEFVRARYILTSDIARAFDINLDLLLPLRNKTTSDLYKLSNLSALDFCQAFEKSKTVRHYYPRGDWYHPRIIFGRLDFLGYPPFAVSPLIIAMREVHHAQ